ncbi:SCO family protein [Novosphingobium sp. KCTC 2891]|nr:SCO family protein [Novosphingobium sp. KCTC 2891]MCW1383945.1 SCO family protein [Novosphingobium sp. KCTC 2891]
MHRSIILTLAGAMAFALSSCGGGSAPAERPPLEGAAIGGDFTLTGKDGKPVRYADFAGKYRVVYFGYSFCPDVCPLDVQHLMQGYHLLAKDQPALAAKVQPIFITVDPARDTPEVVGKFAANFGPELIGLTGTPEQIAAVAKAFAVYYQKREGGSPDAYLMDHSRAAYLMGPDGKPVALLPAEKDGKAVAAELAKWVH